MTIEGLENDNMRDCRAEQSAGLADSSRDSAIHDIFNLSTTAKVVIVALSCLAGGYFFASYAFGEALAYTAVTVTSLILGRWIIFSDHPSAKKCLKILKNITTCCNCLSSLSNSGRAISRSQRRRSSSPNYLVSGRSLPEAQVQELSFPSTNFSPQTSASSPSPRPRPARPTSPKPLEVQIRVAEIRRQELREQQDSQGQPPEPPCRTHHQSLPSYGTAMGHPSSSAQRAQVGGDTAGQQIHRQPAPSPVPMPRAGPEGFLAQGGRSVPGGDLHSSSNLSAPPPAPGGFPYSANSQGFPSPSYPNMSYAEAAAAGGRNGPAPQGFVQGYQRRAIPGGDSLQENQPTPQAVPGGRGVRAVPGSDRSDT